jgi:hypothetical protein
MVFVGTAIKQMGSPTERQTESRIMTADVRINASGAVTMQNLMSMPFDPNTTKSRPTVYQVPGGAVIFYAATGTGEGQMFFTVTDGTNFSAPVPFSVGNGFEDVGHPSAQIRPYTGVNPQSTSPIVEVSFVGKLRGRPNSEVFYGRLNTGSTNVSGNIVNGTPGTIISLPQIADDQLTADTEAGTYRAQGVQWNTTKPIVVSQTLNGVTTPIEVGFPQTPTRVVDRTSGLIRFQTTLGGECYIDPSLGTVRFSSTLPLKSAIIKLTYTPRFLRVSEATTAAHATPTVLWDNRISGDASNYSYWFNILSNGTLQNVATNAAVRPARYVFTYTRAASGAGQAARPYWKTVRVGVQLTNAIATDSSGNIMSLTVAGANGPVQIDPPSGRIYFQASEEDKAVTITYTAVDPATGATGPWVDQRNVSLVVERPESPVPIDQAVNEAGINPFLDPFEINPRRPGLIWMIYSSTRAGGQDLYFQTIAPRFTPAVNGR